MSEVAEHWGKNLNVNAINRIIEKLDKFYRDRPLSSRVEQIEIDHFHALGIEGTSALVNLMKICKGSRGIDIGCGLGGPMRYLVARGSGRIDGIDITPGFVKINNALSQRFGMADKCNAVVGEATNLPFGSGTYDFALMMALSCNVPNRKALYREAGRVLKPGGIIGIFDIVKISDTELALPVPWSGDGCPETSKLLSREETFVCLQEAGFRHARFICDDSFVTEAWFKRELEMMSHGRSIGFEKFIRDWPQMVRSQIRNLEVGAIGYESFVFKKL